MSIAYIRPTALVRIAFGAILLLAGEIQLAAAEPDHMAVLVAGTAPLHARQVVASTIEAVARDRGLVLVPASFATKEAAAITECVTAPQPWTCITPVVRGKGLQQIAVVSVGTDTSKDGSPMLVITEQLLVDGLDTATGAQRFCVRCTDDVLVKSTSELTSSLLQEIAVHSGRTVVAISSAPRGARITFDGQSMGATNRSFNTFPGTHTLILELDGYQRESRSVDAALDKTVELSITMRPLGAASPGGEPPSIARGEQRQSTLAPKIVMAVGALAVVAGGVALALDQKSETAPIGSNQRQYYYNTTAPGIALIIGGAVAGAGGYLWWRHTKSAAAPTITPAAGGAVVGFRKAF